MKPLLRAAKVSHLVREPEPPETHSPPRKDFTTNENNPHDSKNARLHAFLRVSLCLRVFVVKLFSIRSQWVLHNLEQPRSTHAATDTHGHNHMLRATALAFDQRVAEKPAA